MHICKSRNHVWSNREDARKCCNGYKRVVVFGNNIPEDAKNVQYDEKSGVRYARIWVKEEVEKSA